MFSGDYADGVLSNIEWGDGVNSTNILDVVKAIDVGTGDTPFADCTSASEVAEVLGALQTSISEATDEITTATATSRKETVLKAFANAIAPCLNSDNKVGSTSSTNGTYTIDVSAKGAGYYLVQDGDLSGTPEDGSKTRYILEVIGDTTAEAIAKNSSPSVIKKVKENTKNVTAYDNPTTGSIEAQVNTDNEATTDGDWNDVADYNIGDTVPFRLYGSMPSNIEYYNAYRYIFHDTLGSSLSLNESSITVKIGNETVDPDCYTIINSTGGNIRENETFTVEFKDITTVTVDDEASGTTSDTKINVDKDTIVVVEYTATLTSSAVIGLNGQQNKVYLEYSNNPNWDGNGGNIPNTPGGDNDTTGDTPEDQVIVFTYELDITKVDGALYEKYKNAVENSLTEDEKAEKLKTYLKDAEFMLYTDNKATTPVTIYSHDKDGDDTIDEYVVWKGTGTPGDTSYTVVDETDNPLKTDENGKIKIKGLDDGTYYLKETKAPTGYNQLEGAVKLEIKANTQNNQSWTETPSDALLTWDTSNDKATGLKLTIGEDESAEITYSLTAVEDEYGENGAVEAIIKNNKGSSLPSTGGIGTTIFYTVGGVLVVGAGVTLIAKKRAKNEQ